VKKLIFLLPVIIILASCSRNRKGTRGDAEFGGFEARFVESLWKVYPAWANSVGYHKYDSILVVPDVKDRNRQLDFCAAYLDSLKTFNTKSLSENNLIDYRLIENQLKSAQWYINEFKQYEWDPSTYNVGDAFALLLTENYAPLEQRLHSFNLKLNNVPAYYQAAKKNITKPTQEHTDLAIDQNNGVLDIFGKSLEDSVAKSKLSDIEKAQLRSKAIVAVNAIKDYVSYLQNTVKPRIKMQGARDFRIGKDLFDKKFNYDLQSSYTAEQIYQKALKRKEDLHRQMANLAAELWYKYFPKKDMPGDRLTLIRTVLDTLASMHANRDSFQSTVEHQLPELISFIQKKDIIYIDPTKPLRVRQTPDYMDGVAVASINAPGPYDKNANTYYNVGSLKRYAPQQAESFLREYNKYTLQIIDIHEAIPGHYTQLVYSNKSQSLIKSIFGSGSMVEGWAVYTERMMLEEGYGNNDPALWLMYYKWHLRSVCNTLLDYGLHVNKMSEKDAMHLLVDEAFQEETEAKGKYKRASLSQVQLCSYFTGFTEIYDLRQEIKAKQGSNFNLKAFHEKFLSYGSAPVKYIRELMLADMK
jgi:uncharacterized protein (DUF885 family)